MTTMQTANEVARKINATDHGVAITTAFVDGCEFFVIWTVKDGKMHDHRLMCQKTDAQRLETHAQGFIDNMKEGRHP